VADTVKWRLNTRFPLSSDYFMFSTLSMTTAIASFKVAEEDGAGAESSTIRHQRRAYLSPDVLRTYKLAAGEWVCLQAPDGGSQLVIAQLWPRTGVEDDSKLAWIQW